MMIRAVKVLLYLHTEPLTDHWTFLGNSKLLAQTPPGELPTVTAAHVNLQRELVIRAGLYITNPHQRPQRDSDNRHSTAYVSKRRSNILHFSWLMGFPYRIKQKLCVMTIFHNTSTIQINFPVLCLNQMTYNKVQTDYFYAQRCIRRSGSCIVHDGGGVVCRRGWSDRRSCKRLPVNVHLAVRKSPPHQPRF